MVRLFGDRKCEVGCSTAQIREMVWGFLALCVSLSFPVASIERHKEPTSHLGSLSVARDLTAIEVGKKVYKKSQNMTRPNVEIWGYIGWQGRHGKINSIIKKMAFPSSPPTWELRTLPSCPQGFPVLGRGGWVRWGAGPGCWRSPSFVLWPGSAWEGGRGLGWGCSFLLSLLGPWGHPGGLSCEVLEVAVELFPVNGQHPPTQRRER